MNVADYIGALRGDSAVWGHGKAQSPQWHAATELIGLDLAGQVRTQLAASLRMSTTNSCSGSGIHAIIERYLSDVSRLNAELAAFNSLLYAIAWNQTFEYTQRGSTFGVEEARASLVDQLSASWCLACNLGPSVISAGLVTLGRDTVIIQCQDDIARRIQVMAAHVVQSLIDGVASGLLGVVAWPGVETCWYVRNEHRLNLKSETREQITDVRDMVQQSYDHWMACREVHLMDAIHVKGIPGWLDLPERVRNVTRSIPRLLHPFIGTVVGTMICCRDIQWFVANRQHKHEVERPQQQLVFDPAIVIGPVVLTGWESPEHFRPGWWATLDMKLARR
jgi:hypothetical protein